jgi:ribonuclease HII
MKTSNKKLLQRTFNEDNQYELSIDEAGRGCLFGRVYIACAVLPKQSELFDGKDIKDSKKFSSKTKLNETANYIKQNAYAWHIAYIEPDEIDNINILKSVMKGMHECIRETISKINIKINIQHKLEDFTAIIDGNYFTPFRQYDEITETIIEMPFNTVIHGDAIYMGIAAASILAKDARDTYILQLCNEYPKLIEYYGFNTNMGYGTKTHLSGIQTHGITQWHRKTYGICKTTDLNNGFNEL